MRHEKLIKNGDKEVNILVSCFLDLFNDMQYSISVQYRIKPKRKFIWVSFSNDYEFRKLNIKDRRNYAHQRHLEHVTEDEIYQAKLELWEKLKPTKDANG